MNLPELLTDLYEQRQRLLEQIKTLAETAPTPARMSDGDFFATMREASAKAIEHQRDGLFLSADLHFVERQICAILSNPALAQKAR